MGNRGLARLYRLLLSQATLLIKFIFDSLHYETMLPIQCLYGVLSLISKYTIEFEGGVGYIVILVGEIILQLEANLKILIVNGNCGCQALLVFLLRLFKDRLVSLKDPLELFGSSLSLNFPPSE